MKNRLTRNIGLKLASVFLAVVLWLVVNAINNPTVPQGYYNIPVKLLNTDLITKSGQVYEVMDGTDVISRVTVRAPRSVINQLKEENIIATADVNDISSLDTIAIKLSTDRFGRDINSITGSIDTVKLKIENEKYITVYAHCSEIYVHEGDTVEQNTKIGKVGSTGNSTGPHLHFEVIQQGDYIDPLTVIEKQVENEG